MIAEENKINTEESVPVTEGVTEDDEKKKKSKQRTFIDMKDFIYHEDKDAFE